MRACVCVCGHAGSEISESGSWLGFISRHFCSGSFLQGAAGRERALAGGSERTKESGLPEVVLGSLWNNNECFISSFWATC